VDGLLLVHAFPVDARMWEPQIAALDASGVPVVAPHLPGFGGTAEVPSGVMTMRSAASRCLEELDAAGIGRALVCGLSMGGYVAFELWREVPERILGLVLANTRAEADPPEGAERRRDLARRLREEGNVLCASPPPLLSDHAGEGLWDRVLRMIADQSPSAIAAASLGMAERPDSTAHLATIAVPTAVVTSDGDTLIPPDITSTIAAAVPGATLTTIGSAGHLSNLEAPEAFNGALERHLARCGLIPG
jgi:pimeloyl-ACP methyl ester carboxylesterase